MKICFIASSGGHLEEINQLDDIINNYNNYFVTTDTPATRKNSKINYRIKDFNRKNKFLFFFRLIKMFFEQFYIFIKEKPDIIITTGAGLVIPTCLIAKLFKKKLIYIESFARIETPSKTGKLLYKFSDFFIIQHEKLLKYFPKAYYGGWIF